MSDPDKKAREEQLHENRLNERHNTMRRLCEQMAEELQK